MHLKTAVTAYTYIALSSLLFNLIAYCYSLLSFVCLLIAILLLILCLYIWIYNFIADYLLLGLEYSNSQYSYIISFAFAVLGEVLVFFSIFLSKYQETMDSNITTGLNIVEFSSIIIPTWHHDIPSLMNIILCASSIIMFTYSYPQYSREYQYIGFVIVLLMSIIFNLMEYFDYSLSFISINSNITASYNFIVTGLHWIHVMFGTIAISFYILLLVINFYSLECSIGLLLVSFYWQFVDIIWILVYILIFVNPMMSNILSNLVNVDLF